MSEQKPTLEQTMARRNIPKLKDLAARIPCSERALRGWLKGEHEPGPYNIGRLSEILGFDARTFFEKKQTAHTISRRTFVGGIVALPIAAHLAVSYTTRVTNHAIESLQGINQQYRIMQRNGIYIEQGLRGHITTIEEMLESTVDDSSRREIWRILAQAQLLQRLNVTREQELGKAKRWNESAIASARNSGDTLLVGAAIGHLAHAYMAWQHDTDATYHLVEEAQGYIGSHQGLQGWLYIVTAAAAAKEQNAALCQRSIQEAFAFADKVKATETDPYYTDFNLVGVEAFAGNCLLAAGQPKEAYNLLAAMDIGGLAENRHASAFYDISRTYAALGELEGAQVYASQAIDAAVATNRRYIIPRLIRMSQEIQARDKHEPHAQAIAEYAYEHMQQN